MRRVAPVGFLVVATLLASIVAVSPAHAVVAGTTISSAEYPLALDVDSVGNVWIGYADGPMTPKGVTVVPAATGTIFGVAVTAGVETRIFDLGGIQGILMSPTGQLFVANESGDLYVATETNSSAFGQATIADTLTLIPMGAASDGRDFFRGGLAMDSAGNLFGARKDWGGVSVLPAATGTLFGQGVTANTPALLTPGGLPWGGWEGDLAVDTSGNLFINTWFTNTGPNGVYVLPRTTGTLYGQSVTANVLARLTPYDGVVNQAVGIDIDSQDTIYVTRYFGLVWMLSPIPRTILGQAVTADTATSLDGSAGNVAQGVAVAPDSSFVVSGAFGSTRRLVPVPTPVITSISPSSGPIAGGTTVTISGSGLTGAFFVTFGGSAATAFTVVSDSTIMAITPESSAGAAAVQVATAGGTATSPSAFSYVNPPPLIPPGPPINVTAAPVLLGARVTWEPPVDPGTDSLTLYAVRSWPGGPVCQVYASVTSCDVMGLESAQDYYFTVVPMSGAGWGTPSQPSNTVRPLAPRMPSAPVDVTATAGDTTADVSWSPPTDPGSGAVLEYRVTSTPSGGQCVTSGRACLIAGLTNGTSYRFTVEARNTVGWGSPSSPSNAVTPQAPRLAITASRDGRSVLVAGSSAGVRAGTPVTFWLRIDRDSEFVPRPASVVVAADGTFVWQRRLSPSRAIALYVTSGDVRSNTATLPAQRVTSP
jgi:hypothetical protein